MEIWKDIKGYEGRYQISNHGNVKRLCNCKKRKEQLIKPSIKNGYYFVVLIKENIKKNYYIHRLVAEVFVVHPQGCDFVNHKDECRTNNHFSNLEWCTQSYNNSYGTRRLREIVTKSKRVEQLLNGVVIRTWQSTKDADRNGYISGCISLCCNHKRKTHAGYEWRWAT